LPIVDCRLSIEKARWRRLLAGVCRLPIDNEAIRHTAFQSTSDNPTMTADA
jgi:hypothetical protein